MSVPKYTPASCCKKGKLWISWELKQPLKKSKYGPFAQEGEGPERDGWAMLAGDNCLVNIDYCPFCGKKFE
jgi:hypothetical protein